LLRSKFYSLHQIPSTNIIFGYKHLSFTIIFLHLLIHSLLFLFVVFIVVVFCPISYSTHSHWEYISSTPFPLPPNPSNFTLMFDFAFDDSNPFEFLHYYSNALCNMVTFHATGCLDLTVMVDDSRTTIVSKHCLCIMFIF
jgi:hypothetical protein